MTYNPLYLSAGELRHSIIISSVSSTQDASGQLVPTGSPILTTRAAMKMVKGVEQAQNNLITSQKTYQFRIRYTTTSIQAGFTIALGSEVFNIQTVDNIQHRNRVIEIIAFSVNQ